MLQPRDGRNLYKEFLIRLFAGVKLLHRRFRAIFQHTKVDSGVRALADKSITAEVLCYLLHLFQRNGRYCNWLSPDCGDDRGWGWGPARSIVTTCIGKILSRERNMGIIVLLPLANIVVRRAAA